MPYKLFENKYICCEKVNKNNLLSKKFIIYYLLPVNNIIMNCFIILLYKSILILLE